MKHTSRQLEKFKIELYDYELDLIETALEQFKQYPENDEQITKADNLIQKLYSKAYN